VRIFFYYVLVAIDAFIKLDILFAYLLIFSRSPSNVCAHPWLKGCIKTSAHFFQPAAPTNPDHCLGARKKIRALFKTGFFLLARWMCGNKWRVGPYVKYAYIERGVQNAAFPPLSEGADKKLIYGPVAECIYILIVCALFHSSPAVRGERASIWWRSDACLLLCRCFHWWMDASIYAAAVGDFNERRPSSESVRDLALMMVTKPSSFLSKYRVEIIF
jgi:hypothetical protein